MCAYHPYIEKIISTHQLKYIVGIMYNLYGYSTEIRYVIEKNKKLKIEQNPKFYGSNHVEIPSQIRKKKSKI